MNESLEKIVPAGHIYIRGNVLEKGNIIGMAADKTAWAKDLGLPKKAEYTLFAGCGYQFMKYAEGLVGLSRGMEKIGIGMERTIGLSHILTKVGVDLPSITAKLTAAQREDPYTRILISSVSILRKLGVDLGYMYEDEPCCGSPLYYAGFKNDYIQNARSVFGVFKSLGIQRLIGIIPACTESLKHIYPKCIEGYDLEIYHLLEIVAQKFREMNIAPRLKEKLTITYHDPCQLSRYLRITEEPREIMNRIEGLELKEPETDQCKIWSTCCGGGGMEAGNPRLSERLGIKRVDELLKTGAPIIVTQCPACLMQLKRSAKKMKANVKVMDLVEILDNALE